MTNYILSKTKFSRTFFELCESLNNQVVFLVHINRLKVDFVEKKRWFYRDAHPWQVKDVRAHGLGLLRFRGKIDFLLVFWPIHEIINGNKHT